MGREILHVLLFVLGVGLVVSLVAFVASLVAAKLLEKCSASVYPPFKSRVEYLEAALEMDLYEFVERAKATPKSVIQKSTAPFTPPIGLLSGISPLRGAFGLPANARETPQTSSEPGKWYRVKAGVCSGMLVCRAQHPLRGNLYDGVSGLIVISPSALEAAVPRAGEWWQQNSSHPHAHYFVETNSPVCWTYDLEEMCEPSKYQKAVENGCLTPVNFGEGKMENQA